MKRMLIGLLASTALAAAAQAHHSAAVIFDLEQEIEVEGVVTRFSLGNPHVRVFLMVEGAEGGRAEWMAEGGSRTVLARNGWTDDQVKPGDAVKIVGHPSRDDSNVIHMETLVMPDGTSIWGEDIPDDSVLENLRRRR